MDLRAVRVCSCVCVLPIDRTCLCACEQRARLCMRHSLCVLRRDAALRTCTVFADRIWIPYLTMYLLLSVLPLPPLSGATGEDSQVKGDTGATGMDVRAVRVCSCVVCIVPTCIDRTCLCACE